MKLWQVGVSLNIAQNHFSSPYEIIYAQNQSSNPYKVMSY